MTTSRRWQAKLIAGALLVAPFVASASTAAAATWKLDLARSRLEFSAVQTGAKFEGKFSRFGAAISFDPDHLNTSHIAVTIDLASAATGDRQRDTALPGTDWFDVAQFPQAKFETTAIRKTGATSYEAIGNLTLRGVTKPLTLPFTLQINGATAHAVGRTALVRNAFGVGQGPWATGQWVGLNVDVAIDLIATRTN
jgi:polyisoprenoid-binding protein YceI